MRIAALFMSIQQNLNCAWRTNYAGEVMQTISQVKTENNGDV
jgi:hypothetical protein